MAENCIAPLLKDHAKIREIIGELKAFLSRFDLPGIRKALRDLKETLEPHVLKEETVLFLIGMKFLRADNQKLPELMREHHLTLSRMGQLNSLLNSGRMTDNQDSIQQVAFVLTDAIEDHLSDEETYVFPALEKLIDEKTKSLILTRYTSASSEGLDVLDRSPLLSLPNDADDSGVSPGIDNPT